jgi:rRNA maturation RNase YbeY
LPVRFFSKSLPFKVSNPNKIKRWVLQSFENEGFNQKIDLNIVFCTDDELLEINKEYLNHDFYTDIITFPIEEDEYILEAEIYISIDRVLENATSLNLSSQVELHRVIIHGVLHLCGYNDSTNQQKQTMRERESYYLSLL